MMYDYIKHVIEDSQMTFTYTVIILFFLFSFAYQDSFGKRLIIVLCSIVVIAYYYNITNTSIQSQKQTLSKFVNDEKKIDDIEFVLPSIFKFHKNPKAIKYIPHLPKIMVIINQMSFVKKYDPSTYDMFVSLIEYFYTVYYDILRDKIDCKHHIPILHDIRMEILNIMSELYFKVPQYSKQNTNIWETIDLNKRKLQGITYRCIKISVNFCKSKYKINFDHKSPYYFDPLASQHNMY